MARFTSKMLFFWIMHLTMLVFTSDYAKAGKDGELSCFFSLFLDVIQAEGVT